ncbi:MAG: DNA polymerase Y family protein [Lautropia sp.]|nr:DNA polymerase Y family protein [Lautropia sp.]
MLWACIVFPQLALDCVLRRQEDPERALALLGGPPQRRELLAVNAAARQQGLRSGQRLSMAQAISDDFVTVVHDPAESAQWQHQLLASWAHGYSAQVHTGYAHALLLEVGASLTLMGGWPHLENRLRTDLRAQQFHHRIAVAPTPRAAHLLAWWQDGFSLVPESAGRKAPNTPPQTQAHATPFPAPGASLPPMHDRLREVLDRIPVRHACLPDDAGERLHRMGIRTLRQLFAMPRDGLQRRFGDSLLLHLDQLRGLAPEPLGFFQPPEHFEMHIELPFAVENHQALFFPLRRMLNDLAAFLAQRDRGVQHFQLLLQHESQRDTAGRLQNAATTCLDIGMLSAERDPELLFELTRTRLEQVQSSAPVLALRLLAEKLPAFVPAAHELFDERPAHALPWPQLRERLRARLGDHALYRIGTVADHRPEFAWRRLPADESAPPSVHRQGPPLPTTTEKGVAPLRPVWLLPTPQPLQERVARIICGPERLESGWWDEADLRRDYYVLETVKGQRAWAFSAPGQRGPWMLHGWF